jgi:hypothetical protein
MIAGACYVQLSGSKNIQKICFFLALMGNAIGSISQKCRGRYCKHSSNHAYSNLASVVALACGTDEQSAFPPLATGVFMSALAYSLKNIPLSRVSVLNLLII